MAFDERIIPAIIVVIIMIMMLLISLFYNFIPGDKMKIEKPECRVSNTNLNGRDSNIFSKSPELYNDKYSPILDLKNNENLDDRLISIINDYNNEDQNTLYITGFCKIPNDIMDLSLVQLEGEYIYTVNLPLNPLNSISINIFNNSNKIKNIKNSTIIHYNNNFNTKMITIKPNKTYTFKFINKEWNLV